MAKRDCRWECPDQWLEWSEWLSAGLHARNRWRLPVLLRHFVRQRASHRDHVAPCRRGVRRLPGLLLFACAGWTQEQFDRRPIARIGVADLPLPDRLLLVIDDSPTKRYGPKVEGADVHHNPTPGRPINRTSTAIFGSRFRWHCDTEVGRLGVAVASHALCPQQTMASIPKWRRWHVSPPSCNWPPAWSSGSFRC